MKPTSPTLRLLIPLLGLVLLAALPAAAQFTWEWMHPTPHGLGVRWLKVWDANTWYMVTDAGAFVKTVDGGTTWSINTNAGFPQASTFTSQPNNLNGAWFWDRNNGIAGGGAGGVMITSNGGTTWDSARVVFAISTIYNFHFLDNQIGYLAGNSAIGLRKTTNGGRTWTLVPNQRPGVSFYDVYASDTSRIVVSSSSGKVFLTSNGGATWDSSVTGGSPNLEDMEFVSATEGYATGSSGRYMYTTNGGYTWTVVPMPTTRSMHRIRSIGGRQYVAGDVTATSTMIYTTTNRGTTWDSINYVAPGQLFVTSNYGFDRVGNTLVIAGFNGLTNSSQDGGVTWRHHNRYADLNNSNYAVYARGANSGMWVGGTGGSMLYSPNGGKDWSRQTSGTAQTIYAVAGTGTKVFYGGDFGAFRSTTNNGTTWDSLYYPWDISHTITCMDMVSSTTGWAMGGVRGLQPQPSSIAKTTDGGVTWVAQAPLSPTGIIVALDMLDAQNGWYLVYNGTGARTTDGGATWTGFSNPGFSANAFKAFDMNTAVMAGSDRVYKTTNGGLTWDTLAVPRSTFGMSWFGMDWADRNNGIIAGASGWTGVTTDGGATWKMGYCGGSITARAVQMVNRDTAFMVCGAGGTSSNTFTQVWRWSRPGSSQGGPVIAVRPDSLVKVLGPAVTASDTVTIRNTGGAPLSWSVVDRPGGAADRPVARQKQPDELYPPRFGADGRRIEQAKDEADWYRNPEQFDGQGGPDSAGYRWIDSDEPGGPTFAWTDIRPMGTAITFSSQDDGYANIPFPFQFQFYGQSYGTQLHVCTNGWASFIIDLTTSFSNTAIPATALPNLAFYPWWEDLNFTSGGTCHYYYDAANARFIVQWTDVPGYSAGTGPYTFQIIFKQSGEIIYQYLTMAGSTLNSATIGIENQGGTVALQVVYNAAYVHNNLAVLIASDLSWLSENPTSGVVAPGDSTRVRVTYNTTGLPVGQYRGRLVISSNDSLRSPKNVPVTLTVTSGQTNDIGVAAVQRMFGPPPSSSAPAAGGTVKAPATAVSGERTAGEGGSGVPVFADAAGVSEAIELPAGPPVSFNALADTVRFRALIRNYGSAQQNSYQVRWAVDGVVQGTLTNTAPLELADIDTLFFQWNNAPEGPHTVRAWTLLATDTNPGNDTATTAFYAGRQPGDTLYTFIVPNQIILGVAKMGRSNKLVFTSGGQSSTDVTDNKWIVTTMAGAVLDTTRPQVNPTTGQGFGFRDLAWDGRWLLTSDNAQVRRIDTTTFTEIATRITGPGTLQRGLAADGRNRIWKSNFTTDPVAVFDSTGATIRTYGVPTVAPYGVALDKWTERNRMWLWYSEPSLTGSIKISKVDTATGAIVQSFDYSPWYPAGTVGGLDIVNDHPAYPRRVVAFMVVQLFPASVVMAIDLGLDATVVGVDEHGTPALPEAYALDQNYPNPFNPSTVIRYALPKESRVTLKVYDILGREVAALVDDIRPAGYHEAVWNSRSAVGAAVATGLYFYRLEAKAADGSDAFTTVKKMLLVK